MKKLTLLLFAICSPLFFYAQAPVKFIFENTNELRQLSDSIAYNAKRKYTYSKQGVSSMDDRYYCVRYVNSVDTTEALAVFFLINEVGSNDALEIKGTTQYVFYGVANSFLDLFPFWKKFIDPSADELMADMFYQYKAIVNGYRLTLKYDNTSYRLTCRKTND